MGHRMVLKNKLHQMCNKIKIELLKACENRLHHHLIENGFRDKDSTQDKKLENNKNDKNVSHAELAAIRTECRSLTKFIKMVDNFINDAVMTLCRQNVKSLLKYIQNVEKSYKISKKIKQKKA